MRPRKYQSIFMYDAADKEMYVFASLEDVGEYLNYTIERIRQLLVSGKPLQKRYYFLNAESEATEKIILDKYKVHVVD